MKKFLSTTLALVMAICVTAWAGESLKKNFVNGTPDIQSINAMAFGPEGILFIGDSKTANIYAIDTKDTDPGEQTDPVEIKGIDKRIAQALGTSADMINIADMAINPISKAVYFSIHHNNGTPALLKLQNDELTAVSLQNIDYSQASISNPVTEDAKDSRDRPLRKWAVSDLGYFQNQVMVTGLSNQEFSSTFRSIKFPFSDDQKQASLEIYHAAHGKYETYAPIKAFTAGELNGEAYLIASYTCTPLVVFPLSKLEPGKHVKGRTVAELGNWNTPLDIITMEKDGKSYLLMANSNRALMKIAYGDIESFGDSLTEKVEERSGTAGVDFIALPFVNVQQLDKLDDSHFIMIQRKADGSLDLLTSGDRWL